MELRAALEDRGIFEPEDIATLRSVFERARLDTDTEIDREARAASLIKLFDSGLRTEEELFAALGHSPTE